MPPDLPRWSRIDLADERLDVRPQPPAWCGLVYSGKRHWLSGPPEAAKTMLSWIVALDVLRSDGPVAHVDFEAGAAATRLVLRELGATARELDDIFHFEPTAEPHDDDVAELVAEGVQLVIIDAAAGAFHATDLDDNKRADVEKFARAWTEPFFAAGIATLVIDHVGKNPDGRGRFAIGSERKVGVADVHLGLEDVKTLTRGGTGLIKVRVHKDRGGFLVRPYAAELTIHSDPDTHALTWTLADPTTGDDWQPTALMESVSRHLEAQDEPASKSAVERAVKGQAKWKRQAIDALIAEGFVTASDGSRGAILLTSEKPFRTTSSDPVSTSSQTGSSPTSSPRLPLQGGRDGDEVELNGHHLVSEDEVERLFHDHADIVAGDPA